MQRQCRHCSVFIDDDRLVACPSCRVVFSQASPGEYVLSARQEDQIYNRLTKRLKVYVFGSFSLLAVISFVLMFDSFASIYSRAVSTLNTTVVERVNSQFKDPRVQEIVESVAAREAAVLLQKQVQPEVSRFQRETEERILAFKNFTDGLEKRYRSDYGQLSADVAKVRQSTSEAALLTKGLASTVTQLERRNRDAEALANSLNTTVTELERRKRVYDHSVKAIAEGSRQDLLALEKLAKESDALIRETALAEWQRVKAYWLNVSHTRGIKLWRNGKEVAASEIKTCEIKDDLVRNSSWQIRATLARELGSRRERGVPEMLMNTILLDAHLEVVRDAVNAWQAVTGLDLNDVFGPASEVERLWSANRDIVNGRLAPGVGCVANTLDKIQRLRPFSITKKN